MPVAGKPIIEHIIAKVEELGSVDSIYIVTNDKFYLQFLDWSKTFSSNIPVKILNDNTKSNETRLGSIGDINFAIEKEKINDDFLIVNSDNLFSFSLKGMFNHFKRNSVPLISLYDVKTIEEAKKFGIPVLGKNNKVLEFIEKPKQPSSTFASIGIYFYPKKVIPLIKKYLAEGNSPDTTGGFVEWLHKQADVYSYLFDKKEDWWLDIGDIDCYKKANKLMSNTKISINPP